MSFLWVLPKPRISAPPRWKARNFSKSNGLCIGEHNIPLFLIFLHILFIFLSYFFHIFFVFLHISGIFSSFFLIFSFIFEIPSSPIHIKFVHVIRKLKINKAKRDMKHVSIAESVTGIFLNYFSKINSFAEFFFISCK